MNLAGLLSRLAAACTMSLQDILVSFEEGMHAQGKELWWNEYGVGGGASQNGNVPAKTAAQAAATPFFGVFGAYQKARRPLADA